MQELNPETGNPPTEYVEYLKEVFEQFGPTHHEMVPIMVFLLKRIDAVLYGWEFGQPAIMRIQLNIVGRD